MQGVALVAAAVAGGTAWRAMKRWRTVVTLADLKRCVTAASMPTLSAAQTRLQCIGCIGSPDCT